MGDASDVAPYPDDLSLNAIGWQLARDDTGQKVYRESVPDDSSEALAEQRVVYDGFEVGIGVKKDDGIAATRRALHYTGAASANGGIDGSHGVLLPGPKINTTTLVQTGTVRRIVEFGGAYYAASDTTVIKCTGLNWASATTQFTSSYGNITDLNVFQGANSVLRLYVSLANGPVYSSSDGTTFTIDGDTAGRTAAPKNASRTQDNGSTYVDSTANISDTSSASVMDLSGTDTLANGDWWLIGYDRPFTSVRYTMATTNNNVSVIAAHYWNGTAWTTLTVTDGTINAGKTLGQTGTMSWTRPNATWARLAISGNSTGPALFYVRFTVSAATDASTTASTVTVGFAEECTRMVVAGEVQWWASLGNMMRFTRTGGITPTLSNVSQPLGTGEQTIEGLGVSSGAAFLHTSKGFGTVDVDGSAKTYLADLFEQPVANSGDQAMGTWIDDLYFAHNETLFRFSSGGGNALEPIGPERFMLSSESGVVGRITALEGDRGHFMYAGLYDGTNAYLMKMGGYRLTTSQDGVPVMSSFNGWHAISHLGTTKITSMANYVISGQPYLVFGDNNSIIRYIKLPKGASPLIAGSGYEYSIVAGYAYLPTQYGPDASRTISLYSAQVNARNLTTGISVAVATSQVGAASWTTQFTTTTPLAGKVAFGTPYAGIGVDVRLTLVTNSATVPAIVDTFTLFYQYVIRSLQTLYEFTVQADDGVVDRMGRLSDWTAADWIGAANTAAASTVPIALVTPDGTSDTVLVRHKQRVLLPSRGKRSRKWGISVVATTAAAT